MNYLQKHVQQLLQEANIVNPEYLQSDLDYLSSYIKHSQDPRSKEIGKWVFTTLYNYIIKEDPNNEQECFGNWLIATSPEMVKHAADMFSSETEYNPPDWVYKRVSSNNPVHFYNGMNIDKWEQLIAPILDYFRASPNLNLSRIPVPEAIKQAQDWHEQFKQQQETREGETQTVYRFADGYSVVKLIDEQSYKREGALMQHCVATYANRKESTIYSLRDPNNNPHVTIELQQKQNVEQIKGKQNETPVAKYIPYVVEFLQHNDGWNIMTSDAEWIGYEEFKFGSDTSYVRGVKYYYPGTPEYLKAIKEINQDLKERLQLYSEVLKKNHVIYAPHIRLENMHLKEVPEMFKDTHLPTTFMLKRNQISRLSNMPATADLIDLSFNRLTNLENFKTTTKSITISNNKITSFKGLEHLKKVTTLDAGVNKITSLKFSPPIISYIDLSQNPLKTVEGDLKEVYSMSFRMCRNLASLKGLPKFNPDLSADNYSNRLTTLDISWCPLITKEVFLRDVPRDANIQLLRYGHSGIKPQDLSEIQAHCPAIKKIMIAFTESTEVPSFKDFLQKS